MEREKIIEALHECFCVMGEAVMVTPKYPLGVTSYSPKDIIMVVMNQPELDNKTLQSFLTLFQKG